MHRTVTGAFAKPHGKSTTCDRVQLHHELQAMPAPKASAYARQLRQMIQQRWSQISDWPTVEAILAANSGPPPYEPSPEEESAQTTWVEGWIQCLLRREPPEAHVSSGASSSWEAPTTSGSIGADLQRQLRDREKEEEQQNERDTELYQWHLQQGAREAKKADEAALQAHLGWSGGKPRKKLRLEVAIQTTLRSYRQEIEIAEGVSINMRLSLTDSAPRMYQNGVPVHAADAAEILRDRENYFINEGPVPTPEQYTLQDERTQELLRRWKRGEITSDNIAEEYGRSMVIFLESCQEADLQRALPTTPPGTTMGRALRERFIGAGWRMWLKNPQVIASYQKWRAGRMTDDEISRQHGEATMAAFWYLLGEGRSIIPTPGECGTDDESEVDTVPAHEPPAEGGANGDPTNTVMDTVDPGIGSGDIN